MFKAISFYGSLLQTSIKASISKRGAFLIETAIMVANNLIFFAIWWLFFREFKNIAGWDFHDMTILMAVGLGGYGLMLICFGGIKKLSAIILSGDLDPFMTQPKNLLLHVAGSRSLPKGWGLLLTSLCLIIIGGITDAQTLVLMTISMVSACLVFTSVNAIAHSLPFWMGSVESVAKKYCDSVYLFALYPTNIYSGVLELVMFTLIPAGVISYLPVELIRNFSWLQLFILIASAALFVGIAVLVFYQGLKRYESGNRFGMRL